jgi:pimeloyl-ACP methyl ester carboxylesterase
MKLAIKCLKPPAEGQEPEKEAIVFLHGTGSNSHMWNQQLPFFLERGHACYLIDLRGHGDSAEPGESTDLAVHLSDIHDTISDADIKYPAYFVGHSLGAIISLRLAKDSPELVKSIFAASVPIKVIQPLVPAFNMFLSGPFQVVHASGIYKHFAWRERTLFEMNTFTLGQIGASFGKTDLTGWLSDVKQPIHFACGRFDPVACFLFTIPMQKTLPNSTLQMFEWGGHNFMDARPEKFNNWILSHMNNPSALNVGSANAPALNCSQDAN